MISPMDFLMGSSLRMNSVSSTGAESTVHRPSVMDAPRSSMDFEMISSASAGLYTKPNPSACSMIVRYSGWDGP